MVMGEIKTDLKIIVLIGKKEAISSNDILLFT